MSRDVDEPLHYEAWVRPAAGGEMGWTIDLQAASDDEALQEALDYADEHDAVLRSLESEPDTARRRVIWSSAHPPFWEEPLIAAVTSDETR